MRRAALLLLVVLATPAAAFAPTGNVVADAFLATLERGGYTDVSAGSVERADGNVVLSSVTATAAPDVGQTLRIDTVQIAGGSVNADNALVADRIAYAGVTVTESDADVPASTIGTVEIVKPTFATAASDPTAGVATLLGAFDSVTLTDIVANAPDASTVRVGRIAATVEERDLANAAAGSFAIDGLVFDVSVWEEPAASQMKALGYDSLDMDLSGKGRWEAATGRAVVDAVTVAVADLGSLSIDASLDGLTAPALAELKASANDFGQLLTLLQNVTLSGLTVRYHDDGLTPRLVADAAKRANVPPEALVQGLVATVPDALAILDAPAFTETVQSALATFLADPGTLTVRAAPAQAITMAQVLGAALMSPAALPQLLNLEITAAP